MSLSSEVVQLVPTFDAMPIAVLVTDCNGIICWVNRSFTQLTGFRSDEAEGRKPAEFLTMDRTLLGRVASGASWRGESSLARVNGVIIETEQTITPLRDSAGEVTHLLWTIEDRSRHTLALTQLEHMHEVMTQAQSAAKFGVFRWSPKTGKSEWSAEAFRLYGLDPTTDTAGFDSWFESVHPDDRDRILREVHETLSSADGRLNIEYKSADGERWIGGTGQLYRDADGHPDHIVGINIDITERKRAEEAVREKSQLLREVFDSAREGIIVYDRSLRYEIWNPFMEQMTGIPASEVVGKDPRELFPFLRETGLLGNIEGALAGETPKAIEFPYTRPDGVSGWVSNICTPLRNASGEIIGVIGTAHEISQRKSAERLLRASEEQLRAMFEVASVGIVQVNPSDGKMLRYNERFRQITGCDDAELATISFTELTHPDDREEDWVKYLRAERGDAQSYHSEKRYIRKDGSIVWVRVNAAFIRDEAGRTARMVAVCEDITEARRVEEENARLADQLRHAQKMESMGRLAGGVAHDFNNLLMVINGYSTLLQTGLKQEDPNRLIAAEIGRAGERGARLTKQLLTLSRKQPATAAILNLNEAVQESGRMFERVIGEDVKIITHHDPMLADVVMDPDQVNQLLMNLVMNARDAMPHGGRIEIETANVEVTARDTRNHPEAKPGRYVAVRFADTGCGMDAETRELIFDPFFTTKDLGRGTGLGLSTVYGIMRQAGGWIDVWSEPGIGTVFTLYFPSLERSGDPVDEEITPLGPSRGGTVLLVEDQQPVRQLVTMILEESGYRVIDAANSPDALLAANGHVGDIDLLITDVMLPGMDGKELAARLRKWRPGLKVIFMSGYGSDMILDETARQSGIRYLDKPLEPKKLAAIVEQMMVSGS
jgi:two-component system cell cycle sensor histidine kinase/response regulator CckA